MAAQVDWYYHRKNCTTCGKSQAYLTEHHAQIAAQSDARKERFDDAGILKLARGASEIWVAKGARVVHFNVKRDTPTDEELLAVLKGPSGNLRAPTIVAGKKMFVGFPQAALDEHLA